MSKGGGSQGPTETTVTNTSLPEFAEPFYRDLLARVGYESAVPYETYPGKRVEYFTAPRAGGYAPVYGAWRVWYSR